MGGIDRQLLKTNVWEDRDRQLLKMNVWEEKIQTALKEEFVGGKETDSS